MKVISTLLLGITASESFEINTTAFKAYQKKYNKSYHSVEEEQKRAKIFTENLLFIEKVNSQDLSYKLEANDYADMTYQEFRVQMLLDESFGGFDRINSTGLMGMDYEEEPYTFDLERLPSSLDWRTKPNVLSPVENQLSTCNACWAFAATSAIAARHAITTGRLRVFSAQQLVSCSLEDGCTGGSEKVALDYIKDKGIDLKTTYPYVAQQTKCNEKLASRSDGLPPGAVTGYKLLKPSDDALMNALQTGPVLVSVYADDAYIRYQSGVFSSDKCNVKSGEVNHAVVAVGYGSSKDGDYYILRNSYGTKFGQNGYIYIRRGGRKQGTCNMLTRMVLPKMF